MVEGAVITLRRSGGAAEWQRLYESHAADLLQYMRRFVRDHAAAEELVQETFVRAIRSGNAPTGEQARPWLFRIASNLAVNELRRRARRRGRELSESTTAPLRDFGEIEQVRTALRSIPPDQAVVLVLALHEGFSRAEIAAMLGLSEEGVKSRMARGRLNFAAAYRRIERGMPR